jgi:hypothetical protein
MKTRLNGLSMVAVGLASLAMLPACGMGEDDGIGGVPIQTPTVEFPAPQAAAEGDSSKACGFTRADHVTAVQLGNGFWGTYTPCMSYCPAGSYTYAVQAKSEAGQGGGDDTALNGVKLQCADLRTGAFTGTISSQTGSWGTWGSWANVDPFLTGNPFVNGRMRIESPIAGDNTAANAIELTPLSGTPAKPGGQRSWGTWDPFTHRCPIGTAICGINARVEAGQGIGDDTALNEVTVACCSFAP